MKREQFLAESENPTGAALRAIRFWYGLCQKDFGDVLGVKSDVIKDAESRSSERTARKYLDLALSITQNDIDGHRKRKEDAKRKKSSVGQTEIASDPQIPAGATVNRSGGGSAQKVAVYLPRDTAVGLRNDSHNSGKTISEVVTDALAGTAQATDQDPVGVRLDWLEKDVSDLGKGQAEIISMLKRIGS
jgi:hypothetical protein